MDPDDPRQVEARRVELEAALTSLERVERELASLETNLVSLGRSREAIRRERAEIRRRLSTLRLAAAEHPVSAPPPASRRLPAPLRVHASEEQAIVFAAGRSLRRMLGDID